MKTVTGYLLILTGGLFLLLGGWYVVEAARFIVDTDSTSGVIVEHKFTHGLDSGYREVGSYQTQVTAMYAPIVEFASSKGESIRFQANWSEGDPPAIGTEVGVRFRAERPEDARISGIASLFGGAAIVLVLGGLIFGGGVLVLRR